MSISPEVTEQRIQRAQAEMDRAGVDLLVIGPSDDFRYFTGHETHLSERLTALLIPSRGRATIVVPRLERPLFNDVADRFDFMVWDETERPTSRIAALARDARARAVAVNDRLWSVFLLQLEELLGSIPVVSGSPIITPLRAVKDEAELALLREASRRTDAAWAEFCATVRLTGQTERQVGERLRELMIAHGMQNVAFCIVASGPNAASPHHRTSDRVIQPGDPVVLDFGGTYEGYYSDITRTPIAGEPDPELARIYQVVLEAQQAAFEAIRPGVSCQEVDRAARAVITAAGYGEYFIHRVGHGIGMTGHEEPYLVEGNTQPLAAGMVMSDEPGIYLPGKWGVRIEDTVAVTASGAERYNHAPRELLSLP